ncbi:MAG: tRNA (guanosine(37)-N1)-methyltransferase TrmD [Planctomycetia bacterium]|nr:tRNA (guanosine(37)-N1)-methyltransferase TrmD [Planctomycetia bacterium]
MRFDILTLFPEIFSGYVGQSLLKAAIDRGLVDVRTHDIRVWAEGKHKHVDDRPFGGGPGMVLMPKPVVDCVEAVRSGDAEPGHLVMLSPQGRKFTQRTAEELATKKRVILLCGRYEGFDERIKLVLKPDEISVGDFVLNGGEVAAMVIIDACIRLIPEVLGDERSSADDSFSSGNRLLEFAQYTRPREFRGLAVPEVLLSGNHEAIARWRREGSLERTRQRRADLLDDRPPSDEPLRDADEHQADDELRRP